MREKVVSMAEAVSLVEDGCLFGIGGVLLKRKPMAFIRALIRRGVKDLQTVSFLSSLDVDLLLGVGAAKATHAGYVGFEQLGMAPNFTRLDKAGEIHVNEYSEYMMLHGFKAASMGVPFLPTRAALGSDLVALRKLKMIACPYTGDPLLAVPAISPDVVVVHALRADPYGNIQLPRVPDFLGENDVIIAKAAKRLIVTVEEVVSASEFRRYSPDTALFHWEVAAVVEAPRGAYPTSYPPRYETDLQHCARYLQLAQTPEGFQQYLNEYVLPEELPAEIGAGKGTA